MNDQYVGGICAELRGVIFRVCYAKSRQKVWVDTDLDSQR